jgi:hypothetical protein
VEVEHYRLRAVHGMTGYHEPFREVLKGSGWSVSEITVPHFQIIIFNYICITGLLHHENVAD